MSRYPDGLEKLLGFAREEQRRAAMSLAPLTVVSAGAGTGKTHTLASRFAWMLASDPSCRVDEILTLTYTKAAADEMRERIAHTLRDWRSRDDVPPLDHLDDAISRIDEAYISTIHSFAARVIKESGFALDIDPASKIVSKPEEREFWRSFSWNIETGARDRIRSALTEDVKREAEAVFADADFARIMGHFRGDGVAATAEDACDLFGSMNMEPAHLFDLGIDDILALRSELFDIKAPWLLESARTWSEVLIPELIAMEPGDKTLEKLEALSAKWCGSALSDDDAFALIESITGDGLKNARFTSDMKDLIEQTCGRSYDSWKKAAKSDVDLVRTLTADPPLSSDEEKTWRMMTKLAAIGWDAWENTKRARGALTFSDLVRHASRAISSDPSYADRFRHIVVDEFQDTDGTQDAMIASIVSSWSETKDRTLFIVGDIKQSIYSFRMADPSLFADYIARSSNSGEPSSVFIPLSRSYRMSGSLIRDINSVFRSVWGDAVTRTKAGEVIRYDGLEPPEDAEWWAKRADGEARWPIEVILHTDDELLREESDGEEKKKLHTEDRRGVLARAAAVRLDELKRSGCRVWKKSSGAYEEAGWGDMVVLVRSRTSYPSFERAFEAMGIPAVFKRSKAFFNRGEVRDVVHFFRAASSPRCETSLASWIESPFSYAPPEMIEKLAVHRREAGISLEDAYRSLLPESYARFDRLRRKALAVSPSSVVLDLLKDTRWLDAYRPESRPNVLANVRRGADILREYEDVFGCSVAAESSYLASSMKDKFSGHDDDSTEPDVAARDDAVRVMTIHSSKGLEFPIVVIADMDAKPSNDKDGKIKGVYRGVGAAFAKYPKLDGGWGQEESSRLYEWCRKLAAIPAAEERDRLLYVAMTRAADRLICLGDATKDIDGTWIGQVLKANETIGAPVSEAGELAKRAPHAASMKGPADRDERGRKRAAAPSYPSFPERFTASAYSLIRWCPAAYRARYRQGLAMKWEMPDGDGYGGADMGSLVHWVMQRWDLAPASIASHLPYEDDPQTVAYVTRTIPSYLRDVFADDDRRRAASEWLTNFAHTDVCASMRSLLQKRALMRELSFSLQLEAMKLVGSIDVIWKDADGWHIRDWKITHENGAPSDLYSEQIRFYAMAAHLHDRDADVDVGIIHLRPGDASDAPERIDDWDALEDDIRSAALLVANGPFSPQHDRCHVCPFARNMLQSCRSKGVGDRRGCCI